MRGEYMQNTDKIMDRLYENRVQILKYFAVAVALAVVRSVFDIIIPQPISFTLWAALLYPLLKFIVFKYRAPEIYTLMKNIMIYIFCVAALWLTHQFFVGVLYMLCANITLALAVGGAINEILCALLMFRVVFRQKKK